jgi:hypothetical protein
MAATAPLDAQIAYVLARFVKNVRSLSVDPIVVRANWIDALDHVTAREARILNACRTWHRSLIGIISATARRSPRTLERKEKRTKTVK